MTLCMCVRLSFSLPLSLSRSIFSLQLISDWSKAEKSAFLFSLSLSLSPENSFRSQIVFFNIDQMCSIFSFFSARMKIDVVARRCR